MSKQRKSIDCLIPMDRLIDNYQHHPRMLQVEILKDKLKQEKLQDKIFYQSIKKKNVTESEYDTE